MDSNKTGGDSRIEGFGGRVAKARRQLSAKREGSSREASVTQKMLAGWMDVHLKTVQAWEKGKVPEVGTVARLAGVLHTTPEWLLFGIETAPLRYTPPGTLGAIPISGTANESEHPNGENE